MLLLVSPWGPVWGPGLHLGLQPAPGEHRRKASSGRCDQNLQSPGSLGQVQRDAGKEAEVGKVFRKGENQGHVSESHTQHWSPCPGLAPYLSACRDWVQSPPQRGLPQCQAPGESPCPHQLQHFVHFCLCLAMCPWTSLEAPQFSHLCCPVHHLQISQIRPQGQVLLFPKLVKLLALRKHSVNFY